MSIPGPAEEAASLVETGITELDKILLGGLTPNRVYLLEGTPGSGKTTFALQFLMRGRDRGEKGLYLTLSETRDELLEAARSHGWSLDGIEIFELIAPETELEPDNQFTMFQPSEVELSVTTRAILAEVERISPSRVVFDSFSEMRLLTQSPLRFRRQALALKQFFIGRQCTVVLLDEKTTEGDEHQLQSIAHGVLSLEQLAPEYGAERRRLRVIKMRGRKYLGGYHDYTIVRGRTEVFPRLVAAEHQQDFRHGQLKSGIAEVDELLGGGIELGTSVVLLGPAGVGKSSLAIQYAMAAAGEGHRAAVFAFDESLQTMYQRMEGLGLPIEGHLDSGLLSIQMVDPAELSPGEFAHAVRNAVERPDGTPGAKVVVIDSLNSYFNAMPEERFLSIQLHELLTYLGHQGVVTFLIVAQYGLLGGAMLTPLDTSYLADSVILFRYFESKGEVRQAISVLKKRSGRHERTIREFRMGDGGIAVGQPLRDFHGLLTGTPSFAGSEESTRQADR